MLACFLVTLDGSFVSVKLPEELLVQLAKNLRENGKEIVHFENRSIEVEGIYIPGKGSKTKMMLIPDKEEE